MFVMIIIYIIGIIAFFIHYFSLKKGERTKEKTLELFLLYQLVFSLGITSFIAFIGLTFMPKLVAEHMQWPMCPFQQELANVNFAYGVLGLMCIWQRGNFWTATIIGFSIWIFGDGIHHIIDALETGNTGPGNLGVILYTDLIVPIILLILLGWYQSVQSGNQAKVKRKAKEK